MLSLVFEDKETIGSHSCRRLELRRVQSKVIVLLGKTALGVCPAMVHI